jgi:hypothetical protein
MDAADVGANCAAISNDDESRMGVDVIVLTSGTCGTWASEEPQVKRQVVRSATKAMR